MFERDFEELLKNHTDVLDDKQRFKGLIKDYFPCQQMQMNLLLMAYEFDIHREIEGAVRMNNAFAYRFVKKLVDDYGISRVNADYIISVWCVCYGQHVLHKPCDLKIASEKGKPAIEAIEKNNIQYGDLFQYVKSSQSHGLAVSGFTGDNKKTVIFQNICGNKPVLEVADAAFMESEIQEAIFTDGIEIIGNRAFLGSRYLTQAILPTTLKEIGNYAFSGCSSLSLATLPDSLERIGNYAFSATKLKEVKIPSSVYWIGERAFSLCPQLTKVEIPKNIIELSNHLFYGCEALKKVVLHEEMVSIGVGAFAGCRNLDTVYIPDSVTTIGANAFANTHEKFILMCSFGSYAESYARKNKLRYQLV